MEGDDIYPFKLFQHLIRRWRLVFPQAEDMFARRRPVVLRAEYQPRPIPFDNLQAVALVKGYILWQLVSVIRL